MKVEKVLVNLEKLLSKWGISNSNWIFAAQYAERLLGYDIKVREGHLNILVNRTRIPWEFGEDLETYPPADTKYYQQYKNFMNQTGFEFDIVPVSPREFQKKIKKTVSYPISSSEKILVQTPWGGLDELDYILSKCNREGWGEEKGFRVYPHLGDIRKAALKKGEKELVDAYEKLATKYSKFSKRKKIFTAVGKTKLKGTIALKGKVKGRVNVVLKPDATKRFKHDEILVTTMTSPKYTVFLGKAAAIVTDEGGVLSHAAIIAREMGIPCVVGTKIATKVFKDGDLVEVDAEKGIVRKVSK